MKEDTAIIAKISREDTLNSLKWWIKSVLFEQNACDLSVFPELEIILGTINYWKK